MRRLAVGHVLAAPFPALRGTQGYLAELLAAEVTLGHEVHLFCYPGTLGGEVPPGVRLHRSVALPFVDPAPGSAPSLDRPLGDLSLLAALLRSRALRRVDVIHGHNHEGGIAALMAGALIGLPVVHQVHGSLEGEIGAWLDAVGLPASARHLGARLARPFDVLLPHLASACLRLRPGPKGAPGSVLPYGVPRPPAQAPASSLPPGPWVAYAGNLDPYQDPARLFAAVARVRQRLPGARLLLVTGDPPERCRALAEAEGLGEAALEIVRPRTLPEVFGWMRAAGLVLVPRTEAGGLPLKLLNALGAGVPVVACAAAAAGLGPGEGVRVSEAEPLALAEAVVTLLQHPQARARLAASALAYARAHPFSRVARACDETYRALLARKEAAGRRRPAWARYWM